MALDSPLGYSIPSTNHAVSVSLPTWADNVGYEEGEERVVKAMKGGYPRFVLHPFVRKLMDFCLHKFGNGGESCLLLNSRSAASDCRVFMKQRLLEDQSLNPKIRLVDYVITPDFINIADASIPLIGRRAPCLYIVLFPAFEAKGIAKEYWQHTGAGISSRFAEYCLVLLNIHFPTLQLTPPSSSSSSSTTTTKSTPISSDENESFSKQQRRPSASAKKAQVHSAKRLEEKIRLDLDEDEANVFVEERFGRNMEEGAIEQAKMRLKERIAGVLGDHGEKMAVEINDHESSVISTRAVTPDSVYLLSCGMAAIYFSHQIVRSLYPGLKTVQFGFPYIDTLKIQEKWGTGCIFFGRGDEQELTALEAVLEKEKIGAVYCEFPSNPLLISPPIKRLWRLAVKHNFLLIVDETIGNFCNVNLLGHCHLLVSSLTKVFSGDSNVMGGSLVVNPASAAAPDIVQAIQSMYIDAVWGQDAIFLERNSRIFKQRIQIINENAEKLCDAIRNHPKVDQLYYPKYTAKEGYLSFVTNQQAPGYGGLFSIVLKTQEQAERFYDALDVYKGPSLGTSFTLVCPYTVLAHYTELDWAQSFGVSPWLVRVSVGLESATDLITVFNKALDYA